MPFPTLITPRLVLRPFRPDDLEDLHKLASDIDVVRHLDWGPNTPAQTQAYLQQRLYIQEEPQPGSFVFAIESREDSRLIGNCGIVIENRQALEASFGYVLDKAAWGRGYATEAGRKLLRFGFQELGMQRMFATCRPENTGSWRVLEKLGLQQEGFLARHAHLRGEWRDSLLYAILAEDWRGQNGAAVIFDMDGVMVNTEPIYLQSNREIFQQLGIPFDQEEYARFVGLSAEKMWQTLKVEYRLPQQVQELVRMEEEGMLRGLQQAAIHPMPGLNRLLDRLEAAGLPLALASSSPRQVISLILGRLGLADRFRAVVSGEDVANGKPAPDIFLLAAQKLGAAPEDCLVIEDSANGVRGAKAAGMTCIGFRNPHSGNQDLSPADMIIAGFDRDAIEQIKSLISPD